MLAALPRHQFNGRCYVKVSGCGKIIEPDVGNWKLN